MFKRLKKAFRALIDPEPDENPAEPHSKTPPEPQRVVRESGKPANIAASNIPLARKASSSIGQRIRKKVRIHSPERTRTNVQLRDSQTDILPGLSSSIPSQMQPDVYTVESFYRDHNGKFYPIPSQNLPPPNFHSIPLQNHPTPARPGFPHPHSTAQNSTYSSALPASPQFDEVPDSSDENYSIEEDFPDDIFFCNVGHAPLVDTADLIDNWNGWPQGHYHAHVPSSLLHQVDEFRVHWATAMESGSCHQGTSATAESIHNGYKKIRRCLGLLECDNPNCARITRSHSTPQRVANQIGTLCACSDLNDPDKIFPLQHVECDNVATIIQYAGGIWYCNGIPHQHEIIPRTHHLSRSQKSQLQQLVRANPTATPAALRAGNTVTGESLFGISDRFGDKKATRYEVQKVAPKKPPSGDEWVELFTAFRKENPGVVSDHWDDNGVVVISIQTPFMAQHLTNASKNEDGLSGLVSDAAQKWFRIWSSCLITTSVYSPVLSVWVPGVYSYANGETRVHYQYHFTGVFRTIVSGKQALGEEIKDSDFAGILAKHSIVAAVRRLSHQLGGEAAVDDNFICHLCIGTPGFWGSWKKRFYSEHPVDLNEIQPRSNIADRLSRGMSVLTKDGLFWYPGRVIEFLKGENEPVTLDTQCLLKYWRHNQPADGAKHRPGCYAKIRIRNMRDGLGNSLKDRRETRLGLWKTTREINADKMQAEEGQTPLKSAPYTTEIRRILAPHISRLQALIFRRNELKSLDYPTIKYQEDKKRPEVDLTGGLHLTLRSQIQNYMYNCIPGVKELKKHTWVTDGPLQDALMLYIAHRDEEEFAAKTECPKTGAKHTRFIRARAWERLVAYTGKTENGREIPMREDVNYQSLALLEDRMFAPQFNPGEAGEQQWGVDVGIHQCDWDPYPNFPDEKGAVHHAWENQDVRTSLAALNSGLTYMA
ncbi:hypothetical protein V5O48_012626 [Marasmius crinis-equi]|uniref:Uncharacterized protein n=1 Tax=Marasmius crinis-equi TaxID=585013 RepID=A0ABR3F2V2_9AGAR